MYAYFNLEWNVIPESVLPDLYGLYYMCWTTLCQVVLFLVCLHHTSLGKVILYWATIWCISHSYTVLGNTMSILHEVIHSNLSRVILSVSWNSTHTHTYIHHHHLSTASCLLIYTMLPLHVIRQGDHIDTVPGLDTQNKSCLYYTVYLTLVYIMRYI